MIVRLRCYFSCLAAAVQCLLVLPLSVEKYALPYSCELSNEHFFLLQIAGAVGYSSYDSADCLPLPRSASSGTTFKSFNRGSGTSLRQFR